MQLSTQCRSLDSKCNARAGYVLYRALVSYYNKSHSAEGLASLVPRPSHLFNVSHTRFLRVTLKTWDGLGPGPGPSRLVHYQKELTNHVQYQYEVSITGKQFKMGKQTNHRKSLKPKVLHQLEVTPKLSQVLPR
jgi:hypothetical protein